MTETPDFDQLTVDLATRAGRGDILPHIKEALRLVWNARGAADLALVNADCAWMSTLTAAGPSVEHLRAQLQALDRLPNPPRP